MDRNYTRFVALVADALATLYPSAHIDPTKPQTLPGLREQMDAAGLLDLQVDED